MFPTILLPTGILPSYSLIVDINRDVHITVPAISEMSTRYFFTLLACLCKLTARVFLLGIFHTSPLNADQSTPQRIITLSPHLAELVFLLGAGDQLSAVVEHSDYPFSVVNIPRIGGASGLDMERILSIKPDLVLAWQGGSRETDIKSIKELGIRVVSINSASLEDIPESLKVLGLLLNKQQRASALIDDFNEDLKKISEKYKNRPTHRIFIEISSQPLMGLTNLHPFGAGLELCGLNNIFSDIDRAALVTNLESVLSSDVDYVLLRHDVTSDEYAAREDFYRISDVSRVAFLPFDENSAFRQTPRLLDAIDNVCSYVHAR